MKLLMLLAVVGCAFHPPAEPPRLSVAEGPLRRVDGDGESLLAVRAGSAYDPPGREGLAQVAATMLEAHGARVLEVGPELALFEVDPARAADLAQWLGAPSLDGAALAAVVEPLIERSPSCEEVAEAALDRWQFSGHPYRGPVAGRRSTLATLSPAEVIAFLRARYTRDGMALRGPEIPALNQLSSRISPRVTPAALAPAGLDGAATLVVRAPAGYDCGAVASDQEPEDLQIWSWAQRAWAAEQPMVDGLIQGQRLDFRVQRPLRWVGDRERIRERSEKGWDASAWQAAQIGELSAAPLGHLLFGQPPIRPHSPVAYSPAWNQQLRDWFVDGPHRVVVVTGDVTEYLDGEGHPRPGVLTVATFEDLFQ